MPEGEPLLEGGVSPETGISLEAGLKPEAGTALEADANADNIETIYVMPGINNISR